MEEGRPGSESEDRERPAAQPRAVENSAEAVAGHAVDSVRRPDK